MSIWNSERHDEDSSATTHTITHPTGAGPIALRGPCRRSSASSHRWGMASRYCAACRNTAGCGEWRCLGHVATSPRVAGRRRPDRATPWQGNLCSRWSCRGADASVLSLRHRRRRSAQVTHPVAPVGRCDTGSCKATGHRPRRSRPATPAAAVSGWSAATT